MGNRDYRSWSALAALSSLPMLGAALGALADERRQLGFTTWRSACRAGGVNLGTLLEFTVELLPLAIIGMLAGGLALLLGGWVVLTDGKTRRPHAQACIAAHAGCAITLPAALVLCALLPPLWMLAADAALATAASWFVLTQLRSNSRSPAAHP